MSGEKFANFNEFYSEFERTEQYNYSVKWMKQERRRPARRTHSNQSEQTSTIYTEATGEK